MRHLSTTIQRAEVSEGWHSGFVVLSLVRNTVKKIINVPLNIRISDVTSDEATRYTHNLKPVSL